MAELEMLPELVQLAAKWVSPAPAPALLAVVDSAPLQLINIFND